MGPPESPAARPAAKLAGHALLHGARALSMSWAPICLSAQARALAACGCGRTGSTSIDHRSRVLQSV